MSPATLAAIAAALRAVPQLKIRVGDPHEGEWINDLDYPALAALVAGWVGPIEKAVNDLLTELAWSSADDISMGANDPTCIKVRAALSALPWRTP